MIFQITRAECFIIFFYQMKSSLVRCFWASSFDFRDFLLPPLLEEFAEELLLCRLATWAGVGEDSHASEGNWKELGREDVGGCGVVRGEGELLCDVIRVSWWGSLDCLRWWKLGALLSMADAIDGSFEIKEIIKNCVQKITSYTKLFVLKHYKSQFFWCRI